MMENTNKPASPAGVVGQKEQVLIVDDDASVLLSLERLLSRAGYDVVKAEGGEAGIILLEQTQPLSLLIVDYWMGGINGEEVLAAALKTRPEMPRIALTGNADLSELAECVNTGLAALVLLKPWDDEGLLRIIADQISAYHARYDYARLARQLKEQRRELDALRAGIAQPQVTAAAAVSHVSADDTVQDLIALLAFQLDSQTKGSGQSKRLAQLSSSLAVAKGLSEDKVRQVETAALLKDIAQIAAPEPTGGKGRGAPEGLAPELQPLIAGEILNRISGFEEIAEMVKQLQASAVGTAAPDHKNMSLGNQILAVANTFDRELYPDGKPTAARPTSAVNAIGAAAGHELSSELVQLFCQQVLPAYAQAGAKEVEIGAYDLESGMVLSRDVMNIQGIPLLAAGTVLDRESIKHMRDNEGFSPLLSRVFIKTSTISVADGEGDLTGALAAAAQGAGAGQAGVARMHAANKPSASPANEQRPAANKKAAVGGTAPEDGASPVVVIVDDEPSVIAALRRELTSNGYAVVGFSSPEQGLQYFEDGGEAFALISDYMMPEMMGNLLLARVQSIRPEIPCIVLTGHATQDTVSKLVRSVRLTRVLRKPWDKDVLLQALDAFKEQPA